MPQPNLHHWDVLDHSLETVAMLEQLVTLLLGDSAAIASSALNTSEKEDLPNLLTLQALLREADAQGLYKLSELGAPPMKLAALLHDIGKPTTYTVEESGDIHFYYHPQAGVPIAETIMRRISAGAHDRRLIQRVVAHHMRPGQLSHAGTTPRAVRRFFVDLGPHGIPIALISLADHLAMRGPEPLTEIWTRHLSTVVLLLTRYIRERDRVLPPRILQADELIKRLHLEPGPIIGELLEAISEAQAEGRILSKEDALWVAQEKMYNS
jgi:putative nucleotidyltransferase with HDIG domain